MAQRRPTFRVIVRNLVRKHVTRLNQCLRGGNRFDDTTAAAVDDFVLYLIHDNDCDDTSVTLYINEEFVAAPQYWVALLIRRRPYLISRADCLAQQNIDNTVQLDLSRIINIPLEEADDEEAEEIRRRHHQDETPLNRSLSASTTTTTTTTTIVSSSFRERNNEILLRKTRRKYGIYVETQYSLFSLASHIKSGGLTDDDIAIESDTPQYLKIVIDYALIGANFTNPEHRMLMENKLLSFCNTRAEVGLSLQYLCFVDFMLNVILCETEVPPINTAYLEGTSIRYQYDTEIKWRLLDECVAWEVFKLRRSLERFSLAHYQQLIDEFIGLVSGAATTIPLPAWTTYCIDAQRRHYWRHDTHDDERILVRFEWMAALIAEGMPVRPGLTNGCVWLNTTEFHDYFAPCLYRRLLTDSFRYLWMVRLADRQSHVAQLLATAIEQTHFRAHVWPHLPPLGARANALYEYSKTHLSHLTSPVTRKLAKRDRMTPKTGGGGGDSFTLGPLEAARIAADIDIEDVNRFMPPCIQSHAKKGVHLSFMDRVTVVTMLADMGYGRGETVRLLNGNDKHDITGIHDSHMTKRQKPENVDRILSLTCNALIALDGSHGHTIRCPYEANTNGATRKSRGDHTFDDKRQYRLECTKTLGPGAKTTCVSSPIDYVRHKIATHTNNNNT